MLLLVADVSNKTITPVVEKFEVPRLGKGVDQSGKLHSDSCDRVMSVLISYKRFLEDNYPNIVADVIVTATSAVRDASNRDQFINDILNQTGWSVKLLSGDEEALITYHGSVCVLENRLEKTVVLDIGGGSTEIAFGESGQLRSYISIDMGSVRFSERFLKSNPPKADEMSRASDRIKELLEESSIKRESGEEVIGVAGTVTSIAAIELGLNSYEPTRLNGYQLKLSTIRDTISEFSTLSYGEIEIKYQPFLTGRGDVILGGLLILDEFLNWVGSDCITVSTGGIRHGILI